MKKEHIEYQYLQTQLQSNRFVKSVLENNIMQLLQIVSQHRQSIKEIQAMDIELNARIDAIGKDNELVVVDYFPLPNGNKHEINSV